MFRYFIDVARRYGKPILNGNVFRLWGALLYPIGNVILYGPLKEYVLGFFARACYLHRRRGGRDRTCSGCIARSA